MLAVLRCLELHRGDAGRYCPCKFIRFSNPTALANRVTPRSLCASIEYFFLSEGMYHLRRLGATAMIKELMDWHPVIYGIFMCEGPRNCM